MVKVEKFDVLTYVANVDKYDYVHDFPSNFDSGTSAEIVFDGKSKVWV